VNLDKRVSELRSVTYVTVGPRLIILRLRISAPDPDNKLDEIPPPHIYSAVIDRDLFGHVVPNFRQQFAWAVRFRYIVIAAGHPRLLSLTAERIRRDCDDRD
jgi:hypothetical protein